MERIPYGKHLITKEDIAAVVEVLKSDLLTQGPHVKYFEDAFADYVGCKYAVAVSNGTTALHLCALALGVENGVKVITTPITFVASANCVLYCGGEVVFADINPENYLLNIEKVRELLLKDLKKEIKGFILVNFAGNVTDMESFRALADEFGCWIIEDACHSPGGYFLNSRQDKVFSGSGMYADLAIFSFHPVKHIAAGEGGMITTNDETLYLKLLNLRTHGIQQDRSKRVENHGEWYYEMQSLGYNYRLTDFQAALGLSQLKRAEKRLEKRKKIASIYNNFFLDKDYIRSHSGFSEGHAYHLYVIEIDNRKDLYDYLRNLNIYCQVHYIPVHLMPFYKSLGWEKNDLPQSELYYSRCLSLPIYPELTYEQQKYVMNSINQFYNKI
jgi:UDP-4-amino-4,6-dideoxy-N-acetyl-beta-L-altrosamine transaminase